MKLVPMVLKLLCPVGERGRREFRKEVHRLLATSEDMTRTVIIRREQRDSVRQR